MRKNTLRVLFCVMGLQAWSASAQERAAQDFSKVEIKAVPVSAGLYTLTGVGGNIANVGVSVGKDGILIVDNEFAGLHGKLMDALGKLSQQPLRFAINTHWHGDTIGCNELLSKAGVVLVASDNARKRLIAQRTNPVADPRNPPLPDSYLPALTYSGNMTLHFNDEDIEITHISPGHTDADSVVYFRRANVLHTGDLFDTGRFPIIILDHGGSANGLIAAQERILRMVNSNTKILPGKGEPIATPRDIQEQHDMIVTVRDRIQKGIQAGKTLTEILASKPTAEWDERLKIGRGPGDFVTLIHQELTGKK